MSCTYHLFLSLSLFVCVAFLGCFQVSGSGCLCCALVCREYDRMSAYELFASSGVSKKLYNTFLSPMLLVTLFAPPTQLSAAAALGKALNWGGGGRLPPLCF